jgi:hypothetical protein
MLGLFCFLVGPTAAADILDANWHAKWEKSNASFLKKVKDPKLLKAVNKVTKSSGVEKALIRVDKMYAQIIKTQEKYPASASKKNYKKNLAAIKKLEKSAKSLAKARKAYKGKMEAALSKGRASDAVESKFQIHQKNIKTLN